MERRQAELRKLSAFAQHLLHCQGQMFLAACFGLVVSGVTQAEENQALRDKTGYQRSVQISQIRIDKRYLKCQRKSDQYYY